MPYKSQQCLNFQKKDWLEGTLLESTKLVGCWYCNANISTDPNYNNLHFYRLLCNHNYIEIQTFV